MGGDPAGEKARQRAALSLAEVAGAYLQDHRAKRKGLTHKWAASHLERIILPAFGAMRLEEMTRQDIARLHSSLNKTPVAANRVLATLRALYSWAEKHGYVAEGFINPAANIEKYPERARERFLTTEEFGTARQARNRSTYQLGRLRS